MSKTPWEERAKTFIKSLIESLDELEKKKLIQKNVRYDLENIRLILERTDPGEPMIDWCKREIARIGALILNKEMENNFVSKHKRGNSRKERKQEQMEKKELGFHSQLPTVTKITNNVIPTLRDLGNDIDMISINSGTPQLGGRISVVIAREVYQKMTVFTRLMSDEITGLLEVKHQGNGRLYISDVHMFDQIVTKTQCEMSSDLAIAMLMERMIKAGKSPADLKGWWHSHNSMETSPSSTDETTAKKYAGKDFLVWLITNHTGDLFCKVQMYNPIAFEIKNVPVYVEDVAISKELIDGCKEDIKTYVRKEQTTTVTSVPAYQGPYVHHQVPQSYKETFEQEHGYGSFEDHLIRDSMGGVPEDLEEDDIDCPMEEDFEEDGVRYLWDRTTKKYDYFDTISTNRQLTGEEVIGMGAIDYNEQYDLPQGRVSTR